MRFAAGLKNLMAQRGWTQKQWAEAADVQPPSLSDYLAGKYPPTLVVLWRLLDAGGWTLADLSEAMGDGPVDGEADGGSPWRDENDLAATVEGVVWRLIGGVIGDLERRVASLEAELRGANGDRRKRGGGQPNGGLPPNRSGHRPSGPGPQSSAQYLLT